MWLVESYYSKSGQWTIAYASGDEAEAERQYNMCRSLMPDGIYRLIWVKKSSSLE